MAREVRTEKRGTNPFVIIMIFVFGGLLLAAVLFVLHVVWPELLPQVFGSPDKRLVEENQELQSQLNESQTTVGELRAQLASERQERWIPIIIIIGVLVVIGLVIYMVVRNRQNRDLDLDEAIDYEIPRARLRYGFPADYFPAITKTARSFERVKQKGDQENEYMYFIELQFLRAHEDNRYYHGLQGDRMNTVTIALTSKTYLFREQWYPGLLIDQAIELAHQNELWGFALQKTKLEEDFLSAVETAKNFKEIQDEYSTDEVN